MKTIIKNYSELVEVFKKLKDKIEKDYFLIDVIEDKKIKTYLQNSTFHSLLQAFWESGCSSFNNYEDLRNYYKRIAGLITYKKIIDLKEDTKTYLKKCFDILPLEENEKIILNKMLKGEVEVWNSWSEVKRDKATIVISQLINDCMDSGVYASSKKVQEIIDELNKLYKYIS